MSKAFIASVIQDSVDCTGVGPAPRPPATGDYEAWSPDGPEQRLPERDVLALPPQGV